MFEMSGIGGVKDLTEGTLESPFLHLKSQALTMYNKARKGTYIAHSK